MTKYLFFFLLIACAGHDKEHHWGYDGKSWASLSQESQVCEDGGLQTPIDLVFKEARELDDDIDFKYKKSKAEVYNNGHTIEFDFKKENLIEIEDKKFHLKQMHFHTKSEHALDGMFFPGELHLVHVSDKGELAVVGIFLTVDYQNKSEFKFFDHIPKPSKRGKEVELNLSKFLKDSNPHFYYKGSLTTPPCTENVHWIVFDKALKVNHDDFKKFQNFYHHNDRHVQKINKHKVYHSRK